MSLPRGWQRRALYLTFLVGLVAIAWSAHELRWVRAEASAFEVGTPAETWVIDDPDAAYHLRRVQVAMATGDVPAYDRMIAHPEGSAVPWPRFFDWALALWSEARVGAVGPMGFTETVEREVEATAARVPPVFGALTAILVALAAATYVRRVTPHPAVRSRGWVLAPVVAGLVAAWTYATVPLAIWYGDAGRIDHHVFVALLFRNKAHLVKNFLGYLEQQDYPKERMMIWYEPPRQIRKDSGFGRCLQQTRCYHHW